MTNESHPSASGAVTPYLVVSGAAAAIEFYKKAFGAEEIRRMADGGRIGHAEIRIGPSLVMLADAYVEDVAPEELERRMAAQSPKK